MHPLNSTQASEQPPEPKIKWRQKHRLLWIASLIMAGIIAVIVAVAAAGTIFVNTQQGRSYIVHKVSELTNHTVAISGLTGFLPDHARIELIQVKDPQIGVWLEVRQAQLDWFAVALLFKSISIHTLSAKEIDIYALPPRKDKDTEQAQGNNKPPSPPVCASLVIDHLQIGKLFVSKQIAHADLIAGVDARVRVRDIARLQDVSVLKGLFRTHPKVRIWKVTQEPDLQFNGMLHFGIDRENGAQYRTNFGPVRFDVILPDDLSSDEDRVKVYIGLGETS